MEEPCPFERGNFVTWSKKAPCTWSYIFTSGPMMVLSARWDDGQPTEYSKRFGQGGISRKPGWIALVEYPTNTTGYYDPPLSFFFGKTRVQMQIHEQFLVHLRLRPYESPLSD
jgi:hypothetical protein